MLQAVNIAIYNNCHPGVLTPSESTNVSYKDFFEQSFLNSSYELVTSPVT